MQLGGGVYVRLANFVLSGPRAKITQSCFLPWGMRQQDGLRCLEGAHLINNLCTIVFLLSSPRLFVSGFLNLSLLLTSATHMVSYCSVTGAHNIQYIENEMKHKYETNTKRK